VLQHVRDGPDAERLTLVQQREPTGMLDAILLGTTTAARVQPSSVWVTWCDQVAVHPRTVERLAARTATPSDAPVVMPTVMQPRPYIHLQRGAEGRIVRVLHRREGDPMPEVGESDMGLFALSRTTYLDRLPAYADQVEIGRTTGERNFLPFIPWLARTETIVTFAAENPMEAIGINTPQDLREVEQYLRSLSPEP
jgi:bifunctional N-acetylglucosamine-1-phosphate-uridyltransferase/glucosamine-1-phosphate-acetyltransferase GlmU-like protein